jgi:hypothetical protein
VPAGIGSVPPDEAEAKLADGNTELRRLRSDPATLACRVPLSSEENDQLPAGLAAARGVAAAGSKPAL